MSYNALREALSPLLPFSWKEQLDMSNVLLAAERFMPTLLNDSQPWQSFYIDYAPPFLMRMYRQIKIDNDRSVYISCHYFFSPTETKEGDSLRSPYKNSAALTETLQNRALYHPHSWAAGFRILQGRYKQGIAMAETLGLENPPKIQEWQIQSATDKNLYAFNHPLQWHIVIPLDNEPVSTLMVTYAPKDWSQKGPRPTEKLRELDSKELAFMIQHFQTLYNANTPIPSRQPDGIK